jgi:hypothetical protein
VRPNAATTLALRQFIFVRKRVIERNPRTGIAPRLEQLAMHVRQSPRTGFLVKVVDVLRAEEEAVTQLALEFSESHVRRVWLAGQRAGAAHGIELPDQLRVAGPSLRRGNVLETPSLPQPIRIAKGRDATLGADTGAGEDEETILVSQGKHRLKG